MTYFDDPYIKDLFGRSRQGVILSLNLSFGELGKIKPEKLPGRETEHLAPDSFCQSD